MFLEKVSLSGYRGIARIDLNFDGHTILIGENTWGKSSFLRALWCVLGNGNEPYSFILEDFRREFVDNSDETYRCKEIMFVFTFKELFIGTSQKIKHLQDFKEVWCKGKDNFYRIRYFVKGERDDDGTITTIHGFLKEDGSFIDCHDSNNIVQKLLALNPVFRLRDSRVVLSKMMRDENCNPCENFSIRETDDLFTSCAKYKANNDFSGERSKKTCSCMEYATDLDSDFICCKERAFSSFDEYCLNEKYTINSKKSEEFKIENNDLENKLKKLFAHVVSADGDIVSKETVEEGIYALKILLEHYFLVMPPFLRRPMTPKKFSNRLDMVNKPLSHANFSSLYTIFKNSTSKSSCLILALIAGSMLYVKGERKISRHARPIIIFEDIESRLHPTMLYDLWNVIELLPVQEIITTNSGDLLAGVPITSIRRMTKTANLTLSHELNLNAFTEEELRKIAFHIRINRPTSLFARTWILVEGETEIWVLNEFASILGVNLASEGIRLVEYAQCGVTPLVKLANQFGIAWFLMADGDDAGIHYSENAKKLGSSDNVIVLPDKDLEHYLFNNGFERVYREAGGYVNVKNITKNKIIEAAIRRYTKPGLALEIADDARKRGKKSIPELMQRIIAKALVSTK